MGDPNKREHVYEYVPLSQFSIDSNAIAPGSAVRIIAYSGGKDSKKNDINYFQFIVLNKESGDTVRVLTALINTPGDSDKGTYTTPSMFDGSKGVFDATFEPKNSTQNMVINLSMATREKEGDLQAIQKIMTDTNNTVTGNEWVVVNKSLQIFGNRNYKTIIGILKFGSVPW